MKFQLKVIKVSSPDSLEVALSESSMIAGAADMKILMESPMDHAPEKGAMILVLGLLSDYTPRPFMFILTKGELAPAQAAPDLRKSRGAGKEKHR